MTDANIEDVPLSRRSALAAVAGVAAGGVGIAQLQSQPAAAQVSVAGFTVSDKQFTSAVEPVVDASLEWAYDVPESVGSVAVELLIGDETLASERLSTSTQQASSTTQLSALVTDHSRYSATDFEQGTMSLQVGALFSVQDDGGNVIVETTAQDSAEIEVLGASAEVGGSVEFQRQQ